MYVASICSKYFTCFKSMLQVFHMDVAYVAMLHMFQAYVASVYSKCFICVFSFVKEKPLCGRNRLMEAGIATASNQMPSLGGRLKVPASVNPINRGGRLNMPASVNVLQKTQKTYDFGESNPRPSAQRYHASTTEPHTHSCLYIIYNLLLFYIHIL